MKSCKQTGGHALAITISALLAASAAQAQDAAGAAPSPAATTQGPSASETGQSLNEIVVTGTASASGVKKLDASYSITTVTADQIKEINPISVADLLKVSPGVYPESSGGQTGANIEVAGFPSDSGAPFVTFQINGSPLFPVWQYFTDAMVRLDDTIDRVEFLQGGTSVLYGNGQPGAIANFILRRGSSTPRGDFGVTYGSEGMVRFDGFYGFPVGGADSDWYGSIGGFWRKSDGVRDPQFPADEGGQLTATLSRNFDRGSLLLFARGLKDKNQFVTDTPIYNPAPGKFYPYPGFSPLKGTFGSYADQHMFLQTTPCYTAGCSPGGVQMNMADGEGGDAHVVGADLSLEFGNGWSLVDKLLWVGGQFNINAFFSTGANPTTLGQFITADEQAFGLPAGLTATATYRNGQPADMNENVSVQNPEYITQHINSVSNEIRVSKELFEGNTLTVGNYSALFSNHQAQYDGLNMLLQARTNPNPIVVSASNGTNTWQLTDAQGLFWINPQSWMAFNEEWHQTKTAFFLADSWKLGRWLLDGGARVEHDSFHGWFQNSTSGPLDPNPYHVYNSQAQFLTNSFQNPTYSKTEPSWTVGANYEISNHMSVYGRANEGVFIPTFDTIQPNPTAPVEYIHNLEGGFKYQAPWVYLDLSVYRRTFSGVPYSINTSGGQINLVYGSLTKGVNMQATVTPFENFTVSLSGNYMDGHYTNYDSCVPYTAQDGSQQCESINGKVLDRQPRLQFRVTPAYTIPVGPDNSLKLWVTYEHMGDRNGDQLEQQPLGSYYDLAAGAIANIGEHWMLTLRGSNLTNQIGITEGNARLFGFASGGGVILARSIEGREANFQVKYRF